MTCFVPDFELDEEKISLASTPLRHKVIDSSNEAFAELVWRNGPAVHQLHSPLPDGRYAAADAGCGGGGGGSLWLTAESAELFMEEDEMAMWLDSQMEDNHGGGNLYSELLHPLPGADGRAQERQQPLPLPPLTTERRQRVLGSGEFETVVSSEESPEVAEAAGRVLEKGPVRAPLEDWGPRACDRELGSSGADEGIGLKRKARESLVPECHSEDVEFEDGNRGKDTRHSSSTRRTRAAEVHNLSERRRRDRINERMKALQDLIPRCNKSDKASMLDDAIEYLKSLQLQVQHAWGPPACL